MAIVMVMGAGLVLRGATGNEEEKHRQEGGIDTDTWLVERKFGENRWNICFILF